MKQRKCYALAYGSSGTEVSGYQSCSSGQYQRPQWSTGHSQLELWKYLEKLSRVPAIDLLPFIRAGYLSGKDIPLLRACSTICGLDFYGVRRGCSKLHIHLRNWKNIKVFRHNKSIILLWYPVLVPQIVGGSWPVWPVASNLSVQTPLTVAVYPVIVWKSSLEERSKYDSVVRGKLQIFK